MKGKCSFQFNYSMITPPGVSEKTVKNRAMRYRRIINRKVREGDQTAKITKAVFDKMYCLDKTAMEAVKQYLGYFKAATPFAAIKKKTKKIGLPV